MGASFSWSKFNSMPVIGIMRNLCLSDISHILPLFYSSGLTTIEITMNSPGFEEGINYALETFGEKINIGAGTVCTEQDLERALKAGARFIVTPIVNERVILMCKQSGIPIFAGAYSPTEIFKAWSSGADMVKVFPVIGNGPEYIKAIKAPLPYIKLLPVGSVSSDNCILFLQAGADGLGIGSQLFHKSYIQNKDWIALSNHFSLLVEKVGSFKRYVKDETITP